VGGRWWLYGGCVASVGDESTGQRIQQYRKLRGFTQRGLALRADVAYGTLTKIESGHALASPAVLAALARALSVNITQLTGQPFLEELRAARVDQLIEPLRVVLDSWDLKPSEDLRPRPIAVIEPEAIRLCDEAMCQGRVAAVAAELPCLLDELGALVSEDGDDLSWRTLESLYRCVRHVVLNWGFRDLADIALDRATWAGVNGDDPLAEAIRQRARASNHLRAGAYASGRELLAATLRETQDVPGDTRSKVLAGHTHLGWAVNTARSGDDDAAEDHLDEAAHLAEETGEAPGVGWFGFGPTNVAVHRVAVLIEAGDYRRGVDAGQGLRLPVDWPATRAAHHHMDLGRAYAWLGQADNALAALGRARRIAPQQTRFHPTTRMTVEHLLAVKRRVPEPLASYARWLGL